MRFAFGRQYYQMYKIPTIPIFTSRQNRINYKASIQKIEENNAIKFTTRHKTSDRTDAFREENEVLLSSTSLVIVRPTILYYRPKSKRIKST